MGASAGHLTLSGDVGVNRYYRARLDRIRRLGIDFTVLGVL